MFVGLGKIIIDDELRHVARAVALPGRADVPEIEVDFALGAGGKGSTAAPRGGK